MRLKARPDLHHAPLPDGVYVSSGTGEFALSGWSGFADLMSRCLPLLGSGADEDDLVAAIGTEKARPAVRHLLAELQTHDMVLRLDTLEPGEPDARDRDRHAELLAYLECRSAQPYAAFEEIRSTRVLLLGPDRALARTGSALQELGVGDAVTDGGATEDGHDVAVVVMTRESVAEVPPHTTRLLPVVVGPHGALVGPVVRDLPGWSRWRLLVERTLARPGRPVDEEACTAVACSAAVHLLLQELASVAGPAAYVVAGETLGVHAVDLPAGSPAPRRGPVSLATATDDGHDADLPAWLTRLTHPWLGVATPDGEDHLPQMPVALRRLRDLGGGVVVGDGPDQQAAATAVTLALARRACGGAAGPSELRWLLDGALAHLAPRVGSGVPVTLEDPRAHRLAGALAGDGEVVLTAHTLPGIGWVLVRCLLPGGRSTRAWGADSQQAATEALSRALAVRALGDDAGELLTGAGTAALVTADATAVSALATELDRWLAARSLGLVGSLHPADPHLGPGPVRAGKVRLVDEDAEPPRPADRSEAGSLDALVEALAETTGARVVPTSGWEHDPLEQAVARAAEEGGRITPLQLGPDSVVAGPVWSPGSSTGCPGCAETRRRSAADHVLGADLRSPAGAAGPSPVSLLELATTTLRTTRPLRSGEVVVVSTDGVTRHDVLRHPTCPWCAPPVGSQPPSGLDLVADPVSADDPTRVAVGTPLLEADRLAERIDDRYGPVLGIMREETVPYAMSMAVLAGAPVMGHGRAVSFDQTRSVAVLEAYERTAGFPHEAPMVPDRSYRQVAADAVDPVRLGRYTAEQLAHPSSKVVPYDPDLPIDWAWGVDLRTGRPRLVPGEVGFYQYDHTSKRDLRRARSAPAAERRRVFLESSSGCALGSSLAEATLHALFEVAERDAFLLSWHAARPLPWIPASELADPMVDAPVALVESRGYEVHFLRATQDVDLPVVWVLAVSATGAFPASFTSAGSGADPVSAARSGLREVAQLVTTPHDWDHDDALRLVEDPWRVRELEDHVRWSSAPETLDRVTSVLGGPRTTLEEAFPGWPDVLRPADGTILGTLRLVTERFAAAGLDEVVVVDQSTCEHRDLGLHVAKAVVPGTVPMVFGQAHQRLLGIPRLERVLAGQVGGSHPYDPHPFP